jgi:hypothetical protein
MLVMVMMLLVGAGSGDAATSGPVTIGTEPDVSAQPVVGTLELTEVACILGCSNGRYEETFHDATEDVVKLVTCSHGDTGTVTISFDSNGHDTGPGELNGPWSVREGLADFADLHGEGDFWPIMEGPETGVEAYTGDVGHTS